MKTTNSRIICTGEFDLESIKSAYAKVPLEVLKPMAQSMRERIDWEGYGNSNGLFYEAMLFVIHIYEPNFETNFIHAQ